MATTNEQAGINVDKNPPVIAPAAANETFSAQRVPSRTSINTDEKSVVTAPADILNNSPIVQPTQTVINVDGNPFGTPLTAAAAANEPLANLEDKPLQIDPAAASEPSIPQSTPIDTTVIKDVTSSNPVEVDAVINQQASDLNATVADPLVTQIPNKKKKLTAVVCGTSISLLVLGIISIIPLLKLIIGWRYADQCPINWRIPHYLVVAGAVSLAMIILSIVSGLLALITKSKIKSTSADHKPNVAAVGAVGCVAGVLSIVFFLLVLFCIGWFIAGCIWIFGAWNQVQYKDTTRANYCHPTLYRFAYCLLLLSILYISFSCFRNAIQVFKQLKIKKQGGAHLVPTTEP